MSPASTVKSCRIHNYGPAREISPKPSALPRHSGTILFSTSQNHDIYARQTCPISSKEPSSSSNSSRALLPSAYVSHAALRSVFHRHRGGLVLGFCPNEFQNGLHDISSPTTTSVSVAMSPVTSHKRRRSMSASSDLICCRRCSASSSRPQRLPSEKALQGN